MNTDDLYNFCLAWIMGDGSQEPLKQWFLEFGVSFQEFEIEAKKMNWFVASMKQIEGWK